MKRYALVIGIGKYAHLPELTKPATDAKAVAERLRSHGNFQEVYLENGTKAKPGWVDAETLENRLLQFFQQAANQDALIYFTGHGFTLEESRFVKRGYLATSSCKVKFKDKRIISQEEGISFDALNGMIQEANLSSLLMLLDCCHSGLLIEDDLVKKGLLTFSRNNYCLIAACRSFQEAYALKSKDHSVFTGTLLDSLLEQNARQGFVTALDAFGHIDRELKGSGQEPIFLGMGGAIPIVSYQAVTEIAPDETCPYQGLEAFTEETAEFFFGRQKDVELLWQKLEQSSFIPVIGASGSGKSSLVRAGLIPALKQSGTSWVVLEPIKPGEEPLTQLRKPLEELLKQIPDKLQLANLLRKAPEGLQPLIERLPDHARFLLVIDQFEEVFTVCLDEAERERFICLLAQMAELPNSRLAIAMTMRADFVELCLRYEALKQLIQTQAIYLSSLTGSALIDAIAQPANKQGYHLTSDLLAEIVKDTREEPGFLPLLQFALTKLWEYRNTQSHELTSNEYATIGKLTGALDSHADQLFTYSDYIDFNTGEINLSASCLRSPKEQEWIRAIMLRLSRTGEGEKDTRQRQLRSTLVELAGENLDEQQQLGLVLESLIKGRLLVAERETIDLAHEALIKGWKRLEAWCQESRKLRRLSQRLEAERLEWEKDQQNSNLKPEEKARNLMMGGLLAEVREQWEELKPYLSKPATDDVFFRLSDEYEKNQIAQLQQALTKAKQRQEEAEKHEIQALCKSSEALFALHQEFNALLEALRAVKRLRTATWKNMSIENQVRLALQQAVYGVRERNCLVGHTDGLSCVKFSSDGQTIASASWDGTIKLWNLSGHLLQTIKAHNSGVTSIDFSPDGKMLASASMIDFASRCAEIKLWDLNGQPIQSFKDSSSILSIRFDPKSTMIGAGNFDGEIKLWDLTSQACQTFKGHEASINDICFSYDGTLIASASEDSTVKVWRLDGTQLRDFKEHSKNAISIAFSPDGQLIASASEDKTIKLWNLDGELIKSFEDASFESLAFSSDGTRLVAGNLNGEAKIWSLDGQELLLLGGQGDRVRSVCFSPDDRMIASASADTTVKIWSLQSQELKKLDGHGSRVWSVCFSPNGKLIASASADTTIKLWNVETQEVVTFEAHADRVFEVCFSPNSDIIASASRDRTIKLWRLKDQKELATLRGHKYGVTSACFSPDGTLLASASFDKTIKLWNLKGEEVLSFEGHPDGVLSIAISPDGKTIASSSYDRTIRLWNLEGQQLHVLQGHSRGVCSVSFSPDGNLLASASYDKTLKLWDLAGQEIRTFTGHSAHVNSVSFSPDSTLLVSGSYDKTIKLWNLEGQELKTLIGHLDRVSSVRFSPDGKTIVSSSRDRTIRLWNAEVLNFQQLIVRGCEWINDYLQTNPYVEAGDRHLCEDILSAEV